MDTAILTRVGTQIPFVNGAIAVGRKGDDASLTIFDRRSQEGEAVAHLYVYDVAPGLAWRRIALSGQYPQCIPAENRGSCDGFEPTEFLGSLSRFASGLGPVISVASQYSPSCLPDVLMMRCANLFNEPALAK